MEWSGVVFLRDVRASGLPSSFVSLFAEFVFSFLFNLYNVLHVVYVIDFIRFFAYF